MPTPKSSLMRRCTEHGFRIIDEFVILAHLEAERTKLSGRMDEDSDAARILDPLRPVPYGMTSNDAILSPSSLKKNRRSTGLPGKFPTRWQVTTVFPSFSSNANGSHVYLYFVETSTFHALIAARPW